MLLSGSMLERRSISGPNLKEQEVARTTVDYKQQLVVDYSRCCCFGSYL